MITRISQKNIQTVPWQIHSLKKNKFDFGESIIALFLS